MCSISQNGQPSEVEGVRGGAGRKAGHRHGGRVHGHPVTKEHCMLMCGCPPAAWGRGAAGTEGRMS